jgi:hypothetical protein
MNYHYNIGQMVSLTCTAINQKTGGLCAIREADGRLADVDLWDGICAAHHIIVMDRIAFTAVDFHCHDGIKAVTVDGEMM